MLCGNGSWLSATPFQVKKIRWLPPGAATYWAFKLPTIESLLGCSRISGVLPYIADDYPKVPAYGPSENGHLRRFNDDSTEILRGDPYSVDLGSSEVSPVQSCSGELSLPNNSTSVGIGPGS